MSEKNIDSSKNDVELRIQKILVPVDKSGYKDKIVSYSSILAKAFRANITAIHVLDRASLGVIGDLIGFYRGGMVEEYEKALKKQTEEFLAEVKRTLENEGVTISTEVIVGKSSAAEGIIEYAKQGDFDLIIIGTKGMTGVEKFLMGGVASAVVHNAHCPVFAIR
jgi:nucleotide-binding universal stress UspA family protein